MHFLPIVLLGAFTLIACDDGSAGAPAEPVATETEQATSIASQTGTPTSRGEPGVSPTPSATPTADLAAKASQSPFSNADVLHVVQVVEPFNQEHEVFTVETWVDQTTGDVVVRQTDTAGNLRELTVKHGLTVQEYRAELDSTYSSLSVTTVVKPDDPNLPDPLDQLNRFRDLLREHPKAIEHQGWDLDLSASFEGRPAVKFVIPFRENNQVIGSVAAYLNPDTLYPLAHIYYQPGMAEEDGKGQTYSYPTVEPLERAEVPPETFDPEIPEARYTYIRERLSPDEAARFTEYPIWWLGQEFSGYELQSIERYRTTTPEGQMDNDTISAFYLPDPEQYQEQLQIISEPPLTDIEWAHRDANHNVHSWEQTEIQDYPAWVQPGGATMELETPGSFISLSTPSGDFTRTAAESLQPINAASIDAR